MVEIKSYELKRREAEKERIEPQSTFWTQNDKW